MNDEDVKHMLLESPIAIDKMTTERKNMGWIAFTKPSQATPKTLMLCPITGNKYTVKRRGRVEGRVGILIEFEEGNDIAVVDAKNSWLIDANTSN